VRASVLIAALSLLAAGCSVCGLVDQEIVVAPDDPELGPLISDCMNGVPPPPDVACVSPPPSATSSPAIVCACLPLCERVFAIVDPAPNRPSLQKCTFSIDSMQQARIAIEYRSVCQ
jgi:hypothetical protein